MSLVMHSHVTLPRSVPSCPALSCYARPSSAAPINRCRYWLRVEKEAQVLRGDLYALADGRLRASPFSAPDPQSRPAATSVGEEIQLWHLVPSYLV